MSGLSPVFQNGMAGRSLSDTFARNVLFLSPALDSLAQAVSTEIDSTGIKMTKKTKNQSLGRARAAGQDEFYTQLSDIEQELKHYKKHFKNKVVYCNCDDPRVSNFFHYFAYNFEKLASKSS